MYMWVAMLGCSVTKSDMRSRPEKTEVVHSDLSGLAPTGACSAIFEQITLRRRVERCGKCRSTRNKLAAAWLIGARSDRSGGRRRPGRTAARADPWSHRLSHRRWGVRWRTHLPRRRRAPARPARGGDHPTPRHRRGEPDRRHHAHSARPAHPNDPGQGPPGLAEGGGLRPALARGNRRVPLQGHHRSGPSRPALPAQKIEAKVGCSVLNRMTRLGMPVSRRIA